MSAIDDIGDAVREIRTFSAQYGGLPTKVTLTPEALRQLLIIADKAPFVASSETGKFFLMGVPVHVDAGPYPWGSFPA